VLLRFLLSLLTGASMLVLVTWAGSEWNWWALPLFWKEIIFFVFFITVVIGYNLIALRQKQVQAFTQFYLLSISVKLVAGLAFMFFIIWKAPVEAKGSAALFIVSYLIFTFLEVVFLMRKEPS
jgi:hypothetical protein